MLRRDTFAARSIRSVEIAQSVIARHLAQQLEEVDAPLFQGPSADLRQAHPAELVLDLLHVGLDAQRGRGCFSRCRTRSAAVALLVA